VPANLPYIEGPSKEGYTTEEEKRDSARFKARLPIQVYSLLAFSWFRKLTFRVPIYMVYYY
jgi:hypothetical protein